MISLTISRNKKITIYLKRINIKVITSISLSLSCNKISKHFILSLCYNPLVLKCCFTVFTCFFFTFYFYIHYFITRSGDKLAKTRHFFHCRVFQSVKFFFGRSTSSKLSVNVTGVDDNQQYLAKESRAQFKVFMSPNK